MLRRISIAAGAFAAASLPLFASSLRVVVDPSATRVNFTVIDVLHTVRGTFKLKRGEIVFDPSDGKASGELVVDAASGDSGNGSRDSRMRKNVLEAAKYPEITFRLDRVDGRVNPEGESNVQLHGFFRIHGADHELMLPAKVRIGGEKLAATIDFVVPYVKWGMKSPSTLFLRVKDTVPIHIEAAGTIRKDPVGSGVSEARPPSR